MIRAVLLEGRVAVVSGIGPGMGRDIALALAREGADVALGARTAEKLEDVGAEVEALGRRAVGVPTDVTDEDQCGRLAEAARRELGRIDVLVNNAFVQPPFELVEETTIDTWRRAFDVNLFGAVRMAHSVLPAMREQGSGSIVNIGSMSARRIRPSFAVYSATKSALLTFTQSLAREVGERGVRVNTVLPGYIWGPSLRWYFEHLAERRGVDPRVVYDEVAGETCLRHIPDSAEIADTVVYFASDLSRVVTGQALDVNAGHWFA